VPWLRDEVCELIEKCEKREVNLLLDSNVFYTTTDFAGTVMVKVSMVLVVRRPAVYQANVIGCKR